MTLSMKNPLVYNTLPTLIVTSTPMTKLCGGGLYDLYSAAYNVPSALVSSTKLNVALTSGGSTFADKFNDLDFRATGLVPQCQNSSHTTTTTSGAMSSTTKTTSSTSKAALSTTTSNEISSSISSTTSYSTWGPMIISKTSSSSTSNFPHGI